MGSLIGTSELKKKNIKENHTKFSLDKNYFNLLGESVVNLENARFDLEPVQSHLKSIKLD